MTLGEREKERSERGGSRRNKHLDSTSCLRRRCRPPPVAVTSHPSLPFPPPSPPTSCRRRIPSQPCRRHRISPPCHLRVRQKYRSLARHQTRSAQISTRSPSFSTVSFIPTTAVVSTQTDNHNDTVLMELMMNSNLRRVLHIKSFYQRYMMKLKSHIRIVESEKTETLDLFCRFVDQIYNYVSLIYQ
ncbi:uncharacterized protein LOC131323809 [Rhododendron vialii]|uniref:uncharacterized protein LOC131323809 n=1 Tax=Rhododendron vialii TaxID=182163 RepID=UPI00265E1C47|nr:uncharacterized protein LOC131323809 [Rhododendron vialii]